MTLRTTFHETTTSFNNVTASIRDIIHENLEPFSDMSHSKFHFDTFQTTVGETLQQTLELSRHQAIQLITLITRSVLQLSQLTRTRLSSLISTGKIYAFD